MLSSSSLAFLKRLLDSPGPSGYETAAARAWRAEAQTFADVVRSDVAGNSFAEVNPGGSPTIMLDGHIDEIGLIVQYIDDDGYVYIAPIGGWDPEVLVGQRLRFLSGDGRIVGVVGKKPIHLMKSADREKASKITDFWADIGAADRAEAERMVAVGDAAVIDSHAVDLPNDRVVSRSIDDRIGAFIVLEALRRYKERPGKARVVAAATTQEEIAWHGGGALIAANAVNPRMAIAVDVTFATDHPGLEKKELGDHKLGSGPVLVRGALISPVVFDLLRETAGAGKIPYTVHAEGRATSTNADAIHLAREGVATGLVAIPNRYMHSPNEMVSLTDVDHTAALLADACRGVDDHTDFTAR
ncbi:MAG: M20/M25/M40 family metallo-hydrolase [Gemmatimonadaceae bacterium]